MYGESILGMLRMKCVDVVVVKVIWKVNITVEKHISPSLVHNNIPVQSGLQNSRDHNDGTAPHGHL